MGPPHSQHLITEATVVASSSDVGWPAWAHDHRWAWRIESVEPLRVVTLRYLSDESYRKVRILDSGLRLFRVVDVRVLGWAGILGWRPGFKGRYRQVEPILEPDRQFDLGGAKEYVAGFIEQHPDVYESGQPVDELSGRIRAASTPRQLIDCL